MATKQVFSVVSLVLLFVSSYSPIHARESKFFSKATASGSTYVTIHKVEQSKPSPEYAPAPAPVPAMAPVSMQVENGYGLYGSESDSNMAAPQKEMTKTYGSEVTLTGSNNKNNFEEEMLSEDFNGESLENESEQQTDNYNNNNNGYFDNYKTTATDMNGGHESNYEQQGMSDTRYLENGKYYHDIKSDVNEHGNNGYSTGTSTSSTTTSDETLNNGYFDNYKSTATDTNGGYASNEQQGMSDTRYMENGKYYYDTKSDVNEYGNNGYSTSTTTTSDESLDPEVDGSNNSNEFNTMEEYYQSQVYQNNKEEYVP